MDNVDNVFVVSADAIGRDFIPAQFVPAGADEYYLRDQQVGRSRTHWRKLRPDEIEALVRNANTCADWDLFLVTDEFEPRLVRACEFFGLVRIGRLRNVVLKHHDLHTPAGITNSRIIACDIGDDVAIHAVRSLSHYIVGDRCLLLNIDEMHTTNHAKFGNGIIKEGESEDLRVWMDIINEVGTRAVMPFDGMIPADAYIWARYRDDEVLQKRLGEITQHSFDLRRGFYGTVGEQTVIKGCRIIKDVKVGPWCYIKGANKLKNLTINSSSSEPSQIGEGVEMVNGIVGTGCHVFYGCKAVRFIMGNNSNLKYGARLIHSFLGDNSTVSCCEILHNLIFPAHEQHHNNSFLTASLVLGQSNLAAGATIGSNHNSRANDGEILAGRGFWPGLCTTVKHCCRFASFTLLSKGDYPSEMQIPLPFSLLSNDTANDRLVVMPAYWWNYNMYALARNSWKFQSRDKRESKVQNIEFDALAPDTAEEMFAGRALLARWTAAAWLRAHGSDAAPVSSDDLEKRGRELLAGSIGEIENLRVLGESMEASKREVAIIKVYEGYHAYSDMLLYYAVRNLLDYMELAPATGFSALCTALAGVRQTEWENLGGQLVTRPDVDALRVSIRSGGLKTWNDIHDVYARLWKSYPLEKQRHSWATLVDLHNGSLSVKQWIDALDKAVVIQEFVRDQVYASRKKDFDNPLRRTTFRNAAEMKAVMGDAESNSFVGQVRNETEQFKQRVAQVKKRQ